MIRKSALRAIVAAIFALSGQVHAQYMSGYSELGDTETVSSLKKHITTGRREDDGGVYHRSIE